MTTLLTLEQIQALAKQDMQAVDAEILAQLNSEVVLINQLGHYIIAGGGKRIRPLIAVLAANALGYTGNKHVTCAAFIEFVHTATLLHDDVVDESDMRRGRATANATFGNAASVLVGDFIYTRSFQMMTSVDSLEVLKVMSAATNALAEGEVQQLMNVNDPNTTEENYMRVIYNKTARLFEAATQCVAIVAGVEKSVETALKDYGCYLGTAFQLIDDILDYSAKAESFGKNVGDDFVEGKPTLPLLHAMHAAQAKGNQAQVDMIRSAIENGGEREQIPAVLEIMAEHQSLEYAMSRAKQEAQKAVDALAVLPESEYKQALISLAYLSVDRSY
ncbi:octaprenyl diphosphate synthase [Actinobacillus equuli subsp. haemolyticus]|uniref:Octaprenyl diphosphate synthase n=1 Tax=Actinobacillus equuli subsp. equuli TaxID=202947 RepID=A0A9X4G324_ACTEU|nr:octaprenyl diphosphate synthase [Actinobacillus equuli]MDE8034388.1 octaprenyl diphosphate synthase [Actinobacillus equuli subsp. equuli]MDG4947436.1 octaprenyl diphosphate synthase [Actinobacillus equuli subsp. haemolyticus]WGE52202.1 octaprenyl diphosphate synthase [Actinobacillus equuli subsp. haemolyticus]WGE62533.1 octaprenyl diphosphate synthase [Actinobacillus equuli subsp. haemolyticus]WGE72699.1 octaprenyl diphosphate synthase [Actinobacillus equuli subsp. haemolyticus]